MRNITSEIYAAWSEGRSRTISNTTTDGYGIWLHGNMIVARRADGIFITLAGWNTPTTRERLRPFARIHTKGGVPYLDDQEMNVFHWYKVSQ